MPRRAVIPLLISVIAVVPSCSEGGTPEPDAGGPATTASAEELAFCEAWNSALLSGDESAIGEVLADAPSGLEDEATLVREANAGGTESPAASAAVDDIFAWTELHCHRGEPGDSQRHVAPPVDASFDGLTFCGISAFPTQPADSRSGMVLYGDASAADPYTGPMLGLVWNPGDGGDHAGDGEHRPVTVRGQSGVAAPITVFQQTVLPDLGTVIAWSEEGRAFGLYGRLWPMERAHELVEIANELEVVEEGFRLSGDVLPEGYGEVFSGDPSVTSIVFARSSLYSLRYEGDDGLLQVHGFQMNDAEFEAFRFFTIGIDRGVVAEREALMGNAWHEGGPAVVTWREPDGLVVRIIGLGISLETAEEVATRSRELAQQEWEGLVESSGQCSNR